MKEFFANLKKSTRITMISCGGFIALTLLILVFFVMFPINPSEKVIASFGRESVSRGSGETETADTVTTTAVSAQTSAVRTVTTTKADPDVTRTNYVITVTTGAGFYTGGYITTGTYSDDSGYYDYSDNSTGNDYSDGSWQQDEEEDYYYPLPGETSTSYDDNNTTPSDSYIDQPATEPATDYVPPTEYIPDDSGSQGTDYSGGDSSYSDGTGQSEW